MSIDYSHIHFIRMKYELSNDKMVQQAQERSGITDLDELDKFVGHVAQNAKACKVAFSSMLDTVCRMRYGK